MFIEQFWVKLKGGGCYSKQKKQHYLLTWELEGSFYVLGSTPDMWATVLMTFLLHVCWASLLLALSFYPADSTIFIIPTSQMGEV